MGADRACVRKGARSSMVVFYGTARKKEAGDETAGDRADGEDGGHYRFLRSYRVFNADQIDGLPERFHPAEEPLDTGVRSDAALEAFFARMPFRIRYGYEYAAYCEAPDEIVMPDVSRFESSESHAATLGHEAIHASGIGNRLNRPCFADYHSDPKARAAEELVAELGACMLCAHLGIAGEHIDNHAAYLKSWLGALKSDKRHIFKAAADAQKACDWVLARGGVLEDPAAKAA